MKKFTPFVLAAFTLLGLANSQDIVCQESPIELGIVMDSSSSISRAEFKTAQKFLEDFLNLFDIGPGNDQIRVAFVTYGVGVYKQDGFGLSTYTSNAEVGAAIHKTPYHAGTYTATGPGIKYMHDTFMSKGKVRPTARKVIIVITDGNSQEPKLTAASALAARDDDITMFAVGVGSKSAVGRDELMRIAGDLTRVTRVQNFNDLQNIKQMLAKKTCVKLCQESPIDLGIVLDSSSSIKAANFKTAQTFVEDYVNHFDIGTAKNQVRVAFVTYGMGVYKQDGFGLSTYTSNAEVGAAIHKTPYHAGTYTATGPGIKYMHDTFMSKGKVRPTAKKVIIVITDGNSQERELTASTASAARNDGITIFAVGVGDKNAIGQNELMNIAGDETRVTRVKDFDSLQSVKKLLATQTCS